MRFACNEANRRFMIVRQPIERFAKTKNLSKLKKSGGFAIFSATNDGLSRRAKGLRRNANETESLRRLTDIFIHYRTKTTMGHAETRNGREKE